MAWLHLPSTELASSLESGVSTSESISPSHLQEPCVSSRGKLIPPPSLSRKWKKGGFIRLLYGLTLSPSTAKLGVEKWISSLPVSPANRGPKLGNSRKNPTRDGYGTTSPESLAKWNPGSSSWRTFQVSLMGEPIPFSARWPRSGSTVNGALFELPKLAQTITERESSSSPVVPKCGVLWPTPTAQDGKNSTLPPSQLERDSIIGALLKSGSPSGGVVNPEWVEWLMGWPIGWTELEPVGTGLFPSKQPSQFESFVSVV